MSWESTHEYYRTLREVEDELDRSTGIESFDDLPWQPSYAQIFGDRAGLLLALRRRWQLLVQAQVEQAYDPAGVPTVELIALAARHRGLAAALRVGAGVRQAALRPEHPESLTAAPTH
jgi:hypothetical protein